MPRSNWCASFSEICRAAADDMVDRPDAGRNEAAVGQVTDTDGEINIVFVQVDHAIGQRDPDVDIRVGFEKFDRDRQDVYAAEHDRRSDRQVSSRSDIFARSGALGFTDIFQDLLAGLNVGTARIGEREVAARPID